MHGSGDRRPARGPGRRGRGRSAGGCPGPRRRRHERRRRLRGRADEGDRRRVEPGRRDAAALGRPEAPNGERACCSPQAVRSARDACHAARACRIWRSTSATGFRHDGGRRLRGAHAAGRTPNPCMRCNGEFRFSAITAVADAIGAARIATGHYARIVRRAGDGAGRARSRPGQGSVLHAGVGAVRDSRPVLVPARRPDQGADPGAGAGGGTRRRRGAREPGGVLRRRRRSPSAGRAPGRCGPRRRHRRRRRGRCSGGTAGLHRFTPGQRRGLGLAGGDAALRRSHGARLRPCRRGRPRGPGADIGPRQPRAGCTSPPSG